MILKRMSSVGALPLVMLSLLLLYNNCSSGFAPLSSSNGSSAGSGFSDQPNPPPLPPPPPVGGTITTLKTGFATNQTTSQYVTFGQVFVAGHVPAGNSVTAAYDDGTLIPIQVNTKATHPDGSIRHAVITLKLKGSAVGVKTNINLIRTATLQTYTPIPAVNLINAGFDSVITANVGGQTYTASAASLLLKPNVKTWLSGNMATEWIASGPLLNSSGAPHPHLTARFLVRAYEGYDSARVSVSLDNDYAFAANPSDQSYTLQVTVGGQIVIPSTPVNHYNQSRWRKVFYWRQNPQEIIQHETSYLLATRSVPNYDTSIVPSASSLQAFSSALSTSRGIMDIGIVAPYMPGTGGRPELGMLPGWTAQYLVSQDPVAKDIVLTMGELAGTWGIHYRNEQTENPVTLDEYPYMTLAGNPNDTVNPATGKAEAFPACVSCNSPNSADTAHQPDFAYVPYLVTGDFYFLEELQFWAAFNLLAPNPSYRAFGQGILNADQARGIAWTLRSVGFAAYITPDDSPMKNYFVSRVKNNIAFFNKEFSDPSYNKLGVLTDGYSLAYNDRGFAPWQDHFFTSVLGMLNDLGFTEVAPALAFKTKFPLSLLMDPQFCWILSTAYYLYILPEGGGPMYTDLDQVWKNSNKTMASYGMTCNSEMMRLTMGLPSVNYLLEGTTDPEGYTAVYQMALAYAASSGTPYALAAWNKFMTRTNIADYTTQPQFAIVPRK